jgi:allantoinase
MPTRPRVTWPDGKTVAVWHAPNVEHYDLVPPGRTSPAGRVQAPDLQHYMHRDYGNRVGFWRMLRVVDRYEIPSTVSLSLSVLEEMPDVRDAMRARDWEIMSHGISNLRPLDGYTGKQEAEFFDLSRRLADEYWGAPIRGMLGPKISGTDNTVDLMAEAGMSYHADWIHDEQPMPLRSRSGARIVSMPYSYVVNDVPLLHAKHYSGDYFEKVATAQVSRLLRDADEDGQARVACVATHPFVTGQPYMARHLEKVFDYLRSDPRIWVATAAEIADHYLAHHYDAQVEHADGLARELAAPAGGGVR